MSLKSLHDYKYFIKCNGPYLNCPTKCNLSRFDIRESNGNLAVLTYHNFRHQIGTDLLNNGMTPFEVKEHLGHESMHSTRLYAKVRDDRLTKGYKKLGFIGVIEKDTEDIVDKDGYKIDYS